MGFSSIRLYNFRNLKDGEIDISSSEVFLVGENGQGKTNLIEAVYLSSFGSSFRTKKDDALIRHGAEEAAVEGFSASAVLVKLKRGKKKEIRADGKTVSDRADLIGRNPCIVFCHDDIGFISGPPERQRLFFNQTLLLMDPLYLDCLRRYGKVLKQRNAAVKKRNIELLDIYDGELAAAGLEVTAKRKALIEEFSVSFARLFSEISGTVVPASLEYRPSWQKGDVEETVKELEAKREKDVFFSTTTSGPHRDKVRFLLGEEDFSQTASNGQIRLASLILKSAQAAGFTAVTGRKPILLLDDVLLEMDPERRKRFLRQLPAYEQAFFTFLPDEQYFSYKKDDTMIYTVDGGRFRRNG